MGKPFDNELNQLRNTIEWAGNLDVTRIQEIFDRYNTPVYIIGSGGSLSACYYAANLFVSKGIFAKAITPLELFYSKETLRKTNLIFISASGKNNDILFGFKTAVRFEPISITTICMRPKTKIGALSIKYSSCQTIELNCPAGKDGFLATNSLIAYYAILYRAILKEDISSTYDINEQAISNFVKGLKKDTAISVLYDNYSQSVAVDIESKFTEAGLGHILISDYRNFAHGRHHWFDKRKKSAILALTTPWDEVLCSRTLNLLPDVISKLFISTSLKTYEAAIHLLVQSFFLVEAVGKKMHIDPGKPGVPDYGSKIYNLNYSRLINSGKRPKNISPNAETAIIRKTMVNKLEDLTKEDLKFWQKAYKIFTQKLSSTKFGCIILDYDGTICSSQNRFHGLTTEVSSFIINFLKKGLVIGIVSGRGKSLRKDFDKIFTDKTKYLKQNVILGYYNGSDIAELSDETKPDKNQPLHSSLLIVKERLKRLSIEADESPYQLTFGANGEKEWQSLKNKLLNEIMVLNLPDVQMVESSHSIDIIPRKEGCKNNIIEYCQRKCADLKIETQYLCLGDKGQWPGNDYSLLANPFSLSVDEISADPATCWNICPPGIKNIEGIIYIFNKIKIAKGHFTFTGL